MEDLYTLTDLVSRQSLDSGRTKPARLGVIGFPVAHSASPRMQQPALDAAGIDARYVKIAIEPGGVAETFKRMRALGFIGCNVTVPHKLEALAECDEISAEAREMGAVNTVRFDVDGTRGFNTDGAGFEAAVEENFQVGIAGMSVLIAGAGGGAGGALAVHCARRGVARLALANRTPGKIEELARRLREAYGIEVEAVGLDDPQFAKLAGECQLLVNTSSLGLKEGDPSPVAPEAMRAEHLVFDTIYQPPLTAFLRAAARAGARIANGETMLLHQGALAFQTWFPGEEPLEAMRRGLATVS